MISAKSIRIYFLNLPMLQQSNNDEFYWLASRPEEIRNRQDSQLCGKHEQTKPVAQRISKKSYKEKEGEGKYKCKDVVGKRGFEPPTPASRTLCSTRLSHFPTKPRLQ